MRRLAAFRALSGVDRRLLLEAFAACAYFRLVLYFVSASRLRGMVARTIAATIGAIVFLLIIRLLHPRG